MTTDDYYRERKKILIRKVPCFPSSKSSRLTLSLLCEVTDAYVLQRVQSCMNFRKGIDVRGTAAIPQSKSGPSGDISESLPKDEKITDDEYRGPDATSGARGRSGEASGRAGEQR